MSRIFLLSLFVFCASVFAHAQSSGTVTGRVLDQTAAALPGVTIDLVSAGQEQTVVTDRSGAYRFDDVPFGLAELTFRLINFTVHRRTVTVTAGRPAVADAVLSLSLSADIVVSAPTTFRNIADIENPAESLVGIASAASQGAITSMQLEARPVMRAGEVTEPSAAKRGAVKITS